MRLQPCRVSVACCLLVLASSASGQYPYSQAAPQADSPVGPVLPEVLPNQPPTPDSVMATDAPSAQADPLMVPSLTGRVPLTAIPAPYNSPESAVIVPDRVFPGNNLVPGPNGTIVAHDTLPGVVVTEPPPKIWEGSLELGLNGSEGNSTTFNLRGGGKLKRKTEANVITADFDYRKDSSNNVETADKANLDWRWEHLFGTSPWTWFTHGTVDHDGFQAYDLRVAVDTGVGYRLIKTDSTIFTSRLGGGTSREFGGPNDAWIPEAVFGLEFEHKFNKQHKLTASAEYRPDVSDFSSYRLVSKAGWEILLDAEMHLSMKIGVTDRYDSTPEGREPNDLDYAVTLLWDF